MYSTFPMGGRPGRHGRRGDRMFPFDAIEDQLRDLTGPRGGRAGRGDVRAAVLALLAEEPMHGYQIIREITERSAGVWKPSAGSVYPTLQMLADEGLVEVAEQDGKKVYNLTEAGRAEAEAASGRPAPWKSAAEQDVPESMVLPRAAMRLVQAVAQVATSGTPVQVRAATDVIDEARRRIYTVLAED
ncbi:MAG: helix-turn-helix transcriptional regulator [Propionibacteriaceae bacterium]|uniref:Transcription regulator PadR, N-terminal n=1 Tax=Propionibacterium ruminifibrarum TaxID=1962131 RepID=A0A375I5H9_9ACTN|nr:PadR family transcriptional regulator [Propionibacterium ruminifibrarum]MBE6476780.1 helix-turn-helix transcriptional regulator [Propionibacteriaceae bacterium]SPF69455.1 Transcription regulator PadR, N-terminal [Propionibacterium ruminifibrarum]